MSRSIEEWIGKTDDSAIPMRVADRVFRAGGEKCQGCERKLTPADKKQCDHVAAIINGGANRESNLQTLCDWCHKAKTKVDVAEKARVYKKRTKHLGFKKPRTITRWRRMDGSIREAGRER